ncbi:MAG TPA: DNA-processing protein DprA [Bacteroidales bacterium]|jgi:DNA processing protein|nr:DNA-processing protein DprA [Bacteroidales bacterium]HPN49682.1 DNA-processing protein DprA [Bacteroidales bacterium]HQB25980.1 DNA-processing protein DprA [Bacteroidales bacterium]
MKYTENALNILTARSYKGINNAWIVKNLKGNESVETIVTLLNKKIKIKEEQTDVEEFERLKRDFENKLVAKFENCCDGFVALGDKNFPQHRGIVKESEKPIFLFYKGDIDLLSKDNKNISVIGLLNPEGDIEEREKKIVAQFVKNGATIVSGLAFGCDSISHQQALDSNGKTVAILPSPLNNILPARNKGLAFQIVEKGGLLVTEYGNDFKSQMELISRYKERDRLQALFCDTIVLAASYAKNSAERWKMSVQKLDSGARLAMGFAKDYNIPRAVMYDQNIDENNPMFDLNRDLIKEHKDILVITKENYIETVEKIMNKIPTVKTTIPVQKKLFD